MVLQSFLLGGAIRWLSRALLLTDVWYNQVVLCHLGLCVLSPELVLLRLMLVKMREVGWVYFNSERSIL
jgi:hypothetical protein